MREPETSDKNRSVTVLSVSPFQTDHTSLQAILGHSKWKLFNADSHASALPILQQQDIAVVVCERELAGETWTDLLGHLTALSHPPSLIVTSRFADDRFWAEALNLGAWDVLSKPFDRQEVLRTIKAAWQHWYNRRPTKGIQLMRAAS